MNISSSLQAMEAVGVQLAVTANNVANVNTEAFRASRVDLEDGPHGRGVRVADIREGDEPGPRIPDEAGRLAAAERVAAGQGWAEGGNADLVRELTWLMREETAYLANLHVVRAGDKSAGSIMDLFA